MRSDALIIRYTHTTCKMVWIRLFTFYLILRTIYGQRGPRPQRVQRVQGLRKIIDDKNDAEEANQTAVFDKASIALSDCLDNFRIPVRAKCNQKILDDAIKLFQERSTQAGLLIGFRLADRLDLAALTCQRNSSCVSGTCTCDARARCDPRPRNTSISCEGQNRIFHGRLTGSQQNPDDVGELTRDLGIRIQGPTSGGAFVRYRDCDWKYCRYDGWRHFGAIFVTPLLFGIGLPLAVNYILLKT